MKHEGLAEELVKLAEHLVGGYGMLFAVAFLTFMFRDFVTNFAAGLKFMFGSDFDVDDLVWIDGKKKARIVRQTPTKTVFHLLESDRKLVVPNVDLYKLRVEKALSGANEGRDL
jgi:hypothetical protein|tara:strand:- start:159 stop:500 length:342 start_codon:yes stop_codon:yes gene_type:complete